MKYLYPILKSLFLVTFLSTSVVTMANPIDQRKAQMVGFSFLAQRMHQQALRSVADCRLVYQSANTTAEGHPYYYVFNAVNSFVIVSGDDRAVPVLAYSTSNVFDVDDIPETMRFYLDLYEREIQYAVDHDEYSVESCAQDWALLLHGEPSVSKGNRTVEPLLGGIIWHQNCYYNDLCPEDPRGPCEHVYAGCVATAMSMIMKYWGRPSMGFGGHSYTPEGYPEQSVNYSEAYYNYDIMPNQLTETSTAEEVHAVAELQWHCGVAVNMMYGVNGSGAFSNSVPSAMLQYFGYDESIDIINSFSYSLEQWKSMLRSSFDEGVPILYCGQDDSGAGGHAFVCDGYDDNDMFHFNWGWNGNGNGYYALGALNPSNTNYAFNSSTQAIINMFPSPAVLNSPNAPADFVATAADNNELKVDLTWVNPTHTTGGDAITSLLSIQIMRNGAVVGTVSNPVPGEACSWEDDNLPIAGLYEYEIYAVSDFGNGAKAMASTVVGDVCVVRAELRDTFGDGWNGASLTFRTQDGITLSTLTIEYGSSLTRMVGLPKGMIDCVWHRGSYDGEISFSLYDSDDVLIYSCPSATALSEGVFHSFDNQCAAPVSCGTPQCFVDLSDEESHTVVVSTSEVDGAVRYKVRLNNVVVGEITAPDLSMLYTVDNICQELSFTIVAVCEENGNIGESTPSQPVVFEFPKPAPPMLSLQNAGDKVILDWTVVENASYIVYRDGERIKANLTEPHYVDEDVEEGNNYCYTVTYNCLGESEHSNEQCTEVLSIDGQEISLELYPNPADDSFVVTSPLLSAVEVYDMVGNLVVRMEGTTTIVMNTSMYKAGLYVVKVQLANLQPVYRSLMIAH